MGERLGASPGLGPGVLDSAAPARPPEAAGFAREAAGQEPEHGERSERQGGEPDPEPERGAEEAAPVGLDRRGGEGGGEVKGRGGHARKLYGRRARSAPAEP